MIKMMRAVDFNLWMTLIAMIKSRVQDEDVMQYVRVNTDRVLPEYPRDLAKFEKPSIIVQKIADDISDIGFDKGFVGQTLIDGGYVDVYSRTHDLQYQIDVFGDSNTQVSLLESLIVDDMFCMNRNIDILDYVTSLNNPQVSGVAKMKQATDVITFNGNENMDYRTAIRLYATVIQTIIPDQEMIDLSKWIKVSQVVTI